jgi:methionine-rich copper-binding protein CopC
MGSRLRLILALGLASASLAFTAGLASAHARYASSTPGAGSTVSALPSTLQVTFSEELASVKFTITGPNGATLVDAPGTIDLSNRVSASVPLKDGGAGQYTVVWHNVSGDDGDPNDGSFVFTVAGAAAAAAPAPATNAPAAPAPAAAAPICIDDAKVTPGITDTRVNTYCKRQTIREQNKGKISEVVFNELLSEGVGLETALAEAMEAMKGGSH